LADKVVLAYSGGLDTTVAIPWMKENYGCEVVAVLIDVGRAGDQTVAKERALAAGALAAEVIDAQEVFADEYLAPVLRANALYEKKYPLVSALSRPLICKLMVDVAKRHGADAVAHGCTGKGNDQVRFTLGLLSLDPELEILAPARDWGMSREQCIAYAEERNIPISVTKKSPYSIDSNLWGRSIECGVLEDPWNEPPEDIYELTTDPESAPDKPTYIEVGFESGIPASLDGAKMSLRELITAVETVVGTHGFGRVDMVENRLIGIKSREIYESPAGLALIMAHQHLEDMVLERDTTHFKYLAEQKYTEMVYNGKWFSPLTRALDAFITSTQEPVTGMIRLKLYKGQCTVVGRKSSESLYNLDLATYETGDLFSHESAAGFLDLYGLPLKVWAMREKNKGE